MSSSKAATTDDESGVSRCSKLPAPLPKFWAAPMVGQSELAFRMLCRDHGVGMCSTPMIDAAGYVKSIEYRKQFEFESSGADRPLIVQFAGNDKGILTAAANLVAPHCDGVEINVGCPQKCARKGKYGAFLMDDPDRLCDIVRTMQAGAEIPVLCKIRVYHKEGQKAVGKGVGQFCPEHPKAMDHIDVPRTVAFARRLEEAGCAALTVHGRTRNDGGGWCGRNPADWHVIRAVKEALKIPVISNGNIRSLEDAQACLAFTGCDAVMSATALLANPSLFCARTDTPQPSEPQAHSEPKPPPTKMELVRTYLQYATKYKAVHQQVVKHLKEILSRQMLNRVPAARDKLLAWRGKTTSPADMDVLHRVLAEVTAAAAALEQRGEAEAQGHEAHEGEGQGQGQGPAKRHKPSSS